MEVISAAILKRFRSEKRFSIVAVAEGALSREQAAAAAKAKERDGKKANARSKERASEGEGHESGRALGLARKLEERTGLESRVTILGHLQRGSTDASFCS